MPDFIFSKRVFVDKKRVTSISEINLAIKIGSTKTGKVQNLAKYFIDCLEEKYGEPGESFKRIILEKHEIDPSAGEEYFAEVTWITDFGYVNPTGEEFSKDEKMHWFFTQGVAPLEPLEIDLDTERRAQLDKFNPAKLDGGV